MTNDQVKVHPSEFAQLQSNTLNATASAVLGAVVSLGCLVSLHYVPSQFKLPLSGFAAAVAIASQRSNKVSLASQRIARDWLDVGDAQRTNRLYQGFAPGAKSAAVVEEESETAIAPIPLEDVAASITEAGSDEQNFLFVGKSRSGKTSTLLAAMAYKHRVMGGEVDWLIFNAKPEKANKWGGLTQLPDTYFEVNSGEKAMDALSRFMDAIATLQGWQSDPREHRPMFAVFDEINNARILLDDKPAKQLDKCIALYGTQCMSEESGLWISAHSHNVEDLGLNRKLQQSLQMVVLGRNGKYESIQAVLDDYMVIRSKDTRDRLKAQLEHYISQGGKDSIAFTDIGGTPRLIKLPYYSKTIRVVDGSPAIFDRVPRTETPPETNGNGRYAPLRRTYAGSTIDVEPIPGVTVPGYFEPDGNLFHDGITISEFPPTPDFGQNSEIQKAIAALENGKTRSDIINNVLNCKGRNYSKGKAIVEQAEQLLANQKAAS